MVAQRLREVVADEPKAFAYDIGVSLSALYNYLNGRIPSTEVLFRIARYTGRPMEWFLEGAVQIPVAMTVQQLSAGAAGRVRRKGLGVGAPRPRAPSSSSRRGKRAASRVSSASIIVCRPDGLAWAPLLVCS